MLIALPKQDDEVSVKSVWIVQMFELGAWFSFVCFVFCSCFASISGECVLVALSITGKDAHLCVPLWDKVQSMLL